MYLIIALFCVVFRRRNEVQKVETQIASQRTALAATEQKIEDAKSRLGQVTVLGDTCEMCL